MAIIQSRSLRRGDVYWANLDNICAESTSIYHKTRPVVIMSNEKCNQYSPILTVIPLSKQTQKNKLPTHIEVCLHGQLSICCTEQPISLPKSELRNYFGTLSNSDMQNIEKGLRIQLQLA